MDGFRRRFLDGIYPKFGARELEKPVQSARRARRRWYVLVVLFLTSFLGGFLWLQPILAAFPLEAIQDKSALLGLVKPGTYLLLFQNPRELRATGGFLGSLAEVELGWGLRVKRIEIETNIYKRDSEFAGSVKREAPAPLEELIGDQAWGLRDSNWSIDYPEAAELVAWFYEQEGGHPVDGVIALDTRFLERIMDRIGPIELPNQALSLTTETIVDTLQTEIEQGYWRELEHRIENEPKSILAELLPLLLDRVRHLSLGDIARLANDALTEKEILAWFRDPRLERGMRDLNWDGHLRLDEDAEVLYLNESNLTYVPDTLRGEVGAKSSWSIERSLVVNRTTSAIGKPQVEVVLTRHHRGVAVWPDGPNQSYLRLAVPSGSRIVSFKRDEVGQSSTVVVGREASATTFGFWSRLEPGEREVIRLIYETPAPAETLILQRQPGVPAFLVSVWQDAREIWQGELEHDLEISLSTS